jgi:hypothetical protein
MASAGKGDTVREEFGVPEFLTSVFDNLELERSGVASNESIVLEFVKSSIGIL